ncbi:MAG TPA: hypothetical protein DCS93_02355 [Microscillaceae bacterium]|nr:hypothetical protein [Microscillaceae bacterium]
MLNVKSQVVIRFAGALGLWMSCLNIVQAQQAIPYQNKEGKWGYKTKSGKKKGSPIYKRIQAIVVEAKDKLSTLFIVQKRNKYALFNSNGEQLSQFSYDTIYPPNCEKPVKLVLAKRNRKYGYLDYKGIERLALIYDGAESFCKGVTRVQQGGQWTSIGKVVKKKIKEKKEVFTVVEDKPEPRGGMRRFYRYIRDSLRYPPEAKRLKAEGKVFVMIAVAGDGTLKNVEVLRGIGNGCELEAVRLIMNGPKWQPFVARGNRKRIQRVVIPITFKLK